jgi:hypothetical protein
MLVWKISRIESLFFLTIYIVGGFFATANFLQLIGGLTGPPLLCIGAIFISVLTRLEQ